MQALPEGECAIDVAVSASDHLVEVVLLRPGRRRDVEVVQHLDKLGGGKLVLAGLRPGVPLEGVAEEGDLVVREARALVRLPPRTLPAERRQLYELTLRAQLDQVVSPRLYQVEIDSHAAEGFQMRDDVHRLQRCRHGADGDAAWTPDLDVRVMQALQLHGGQVAHDIDDVHEVQYVLIDATKTTLTAEVGQERKEIPRPQGAPQVAQQRPERVLVDEACHHPVELGEEARKLAEDLRTHAAMLGVLQHLVVGEHLLSVQ
mmetsp:Transcript_62542/g.176418  ORF Transcript_62542/g.176418 Transcript_62542/m.176418 type:complete len:260 (-) Transcript_62542:434-1213(-)